MVYTVLPTTANSSALELLGETLVKLAHEVVAKMVGA
jgi:hypothetical protein